MTVFNDLCYDYRVFKEAKTLADLGHKVTVIGMTFDRETKLEGWDELEVVRIPIRRWFSLKLQYAEFWYKLFVLAKGLKVHVFHSHDLDTLLSAYLASRINGSKLIYDSHEYWTEVAPLVGRRLIKFVWETMERVLIKKADRIIVVSQSIADAISEKYRVKDIAVLMNLPYFREARDSNRIRCMLNVEDDEKIVLYQGGLLLGSGLEDAIDAIKLINGVTLVIIGGGPMERKIKEKVGAENLGDKVKFLDRIAFHNLHIYTCSADVGLCVIKGMGKSFYYSAPNKLFEYIMAGVPVIASDFPEMRRIVLGEGVGRVVNPEEVSEVAQVIEEVLKDKKAYRAYKRNCRRAALKYNWESESQKLIQIYEDLGG